MESRWSSANAKKLAAEYKKSIKGLHPDTVRAVRSIFDNIQIGNKVSFHGVSLDAQLRVAKELRSLGYRVINHGTFVAPDVTKFEVWVE